MKERSLDLSRIRKRLIKSGLRWAPGEVPNVPRDKDCAGCAASPTGYCESCQNLADATFRAALPDRNRTNTRKSGGRIFQGWEFKSKQLAAQWDVPKSKPAKEKPGWMRAPAESNSFMNCVAGAI